MNVRKEMLPFLLAISLTTATAQHVIHYLSIDVCLNDDGSARVTEKRTCSIGSQGTEGYITFKNMGNIDVDSLSVKDEDGIIYTQDPGNWNTERSRQEKTGRCGIHKIRDGVELCWGIGHSGMRTYEVSYTLTKLVKAYRDYDGFNHSFYEADDPPAQSATITIRKADGMLNRPSSRIWAFGFSGNVLLNDGLLMASTTQPFNAGGSMIIMCQFDKGIFHPVSNVAGTFDYVRKVAFNGSDYNQELYSENEEADEAYRLPVSLVGGDGFTGQNNRSSLAESSDDDDDGFSMSDIGTFIVIIAVIIIAIFRLGGSGNDSGGGSSYSRSSNRSSRDRSSGWGGSSSSRGGGGHSGGGGSGFR